MSEKRFREIKAHFEKEAAAFDGLFFKVMPRYEEMTQAVVDALPFNKSARLKVIDLGCGTGNLAKKVIAAYPGSRVTCLDMAENMLAMAKAKLAGNRQARFWLGDIRDFNYSGKYDAIVSSMALHHIEGKEKPGLYRKLYAGLKDGGVFFNIDIFLSPDKHLQQLYMDRWKMFMKTNGLPAKRTNEMLRRHQREDRPMVFTDELDILRKAGFKRVDAVLKNYNFAVYGGIKSRGKKN